MIEKRGERVFRLVGELDLSNAAWFQASFDSEVREHGDLVLDLAGLEFIDCSGRRALAQMAAALATRGRLILRNPTRFAQRFFELTKVDSAANLVIETASGLEEIPPEKTRSMREVGFREAKLWGLLALAQSMMPAADEASVTLTQEDKLITAVATSFEARESDSTQYRIGDGPCVQAAQNGVTVNLNLAHDQDRFGSFVQSARAWGFGAVLSTPIPGEVDKSAGGLNLYSRSPDGFGPSDESRAQILAIRAASILRATES